MKVPKPIKMSSGNWFVRVRVGGQEHTITCRTEKECIKQAQLYKAEVLAGKREAKSTAPTLGEAIDRYLAARTNVLSPSTLANYQCFRRCYFQSVMDKRLDQVKDWQAVVNEELQHLAVSSVKRVWTLVSMSAKDAGYQLPEVKFPSQSKKEKAFLQPEQIPVFVEAVSGTDIEIPALLALCSLRRSEVYGLRWQDIDFGQNTIRVNGSIVYGPDGFVRKEQTKNRSSNRYVPILIPELKEALAEQMGELDKPVIATPSTNLRSSINTVCRNAGLPEVGVHGLRHSFASLCYHLGLSEMVCMRLGGWSSFQTMRAVYTHLAESDVAKGTEALSGFFAKQ